jgi:hypothetical protein
MTEGEIQAAEAICARATPGPWAYGAAILPCGMGYRVSPQQVNNAGAFRAEDAAFVAAARDGWPRALAELRAIQAARTADAATGAKIVASVLLVPDGDHWRFAVEGIGEDDAAVLRALCCGLLEILGTDNRGELDAIALVAETAEAIRIAHGPEPARPRHLRIVADAAPAAEEGP